VQVWLVAENYHVNTLADSSQARQSGGLDRVLEKARPRFHLPLPRSNSALSIPDTNMASTTLGKRRRHDDHTATSSLSAGPSRKKRALRSCSNDENTPPSLDEHARYDATYGNEFQLDELDNPFVVSCNASTQRPIATGRTARDSEVASAPTKINGHFKTVKTTTGMSLMTSR